MHLDWRSRDRPKEQPNHHGSIRYANANVQLCITAIIHTRALASWNLIIATRWLNTRRWRLHDHANILTLLVRSASQFRAAFAPCRLFSFPNGQTLGARRVCDPNCSAGAPFMPNYLLMESKPMRAAQKWVQNFPAHWPSGEMINCPTSTGCKKRNKNMDPVCVWLAGLFHADELRARLTWNKKWRNY